MRASFGESVFHKLVYVLLTLAALSCLLPFVHIASLSLSDQQSVMSGVVGLWPRGWSLEAYRLLFLGTRIGQSFTNSVIITMIGVAFSLSATILAAYPLSRKAMFARKSLTLAIVFTMMFSGGLIPQFLVVRWLNLLNSYWALWMPSLVITFYMLIMKNHFEQLPEELDEAAKMDGCGEWRFLTRIVLPLSLPMLATVGLFYGVVYWNSFFHVLIYIYDNEKYNLAVRVYQMLASQTILQEMNNVRAQDRIASTPEGIRAAAIMVMVIPMLAVYPFLQKYFIHGALIGAIKG